MIRLKQLILETAIGKQLIEAGDATPTTVYEFQDSFPDNIVLPINPKQPNIISFATISNIDQLTPSLRNFINTLNAAVTSKKISTGNISITSEAAAATSANANVPGGNSGNWTQAQVNFSYSNGAKMVNQTLADRRAEGIEYIIKKFVKLPATVTITKSANGNGSKKSARAVVPIQTYNKNSPTATITKNGKNEIFNINATKYTPLAFTDPKIEVVDCGKSLDANGLAGNPIAYRSKLKTTSGNLSINFQSFYIPDRLVILKMTKGQGTPTAIFDSGYVSSDPVAAIVDFGTALDELNKTSKNGYDGNIKQPQVASVDLGDDDGSIYYVEVYAPLGPTIWSMSVTCNIPAGAAKAEWLTDMSPGPHVLYQFNGTRSSNVYPVYKGNATKEGVLKDDKLAYRFIINKNHYKDPAHDYMTQVKLLPDMTTWWVNLGDIKEVPGAPVYKEPETKAPETKAPETKAPIDTHPEIQFNPKIVYTKQ